MSFEFLLFMLAASLTGGGALGVALSRRLVRAAVWLLVCLLGVSLIYFLLGADFLGAAHLIVYVGGTLVLVVFGIMLTTDGPNSVFRNRRSDMIIGGLVAVCLFVALVQLSLKFARPSETPPTEAENRLPAVGSIGLALLGLPETGDPEQRSYLLPFELLSFHLLIALIAAAYLARATRRSSAPTAKVTP